MEDCAASVDKPSGVNVSAVAGSSDTQTNKRVVRPTVKALVER